MGIYLLVDIGSTYTKLTAVDLEKEDVIGTSSSFTTVTTDITIGYLKAKELLEEKIGKVHFEKIYACSSAAGGLKMAAIGLVEELTVEAAKRVCLGAGGKVDLVFSNKINKSEALSIKNGDIDIVLLAGGTDGGNSDCVIHNLKMLGEVGLQIPVVYAGNKSVQDEIREIIKEYNINGYICDNVLPRINKLQINSAREVIKEIFLNNIIVAKGIKKLEDGIDGVLLPTPSAVMNAIELLGSGYMDQEGLGEIVLVDIGGATTDVYSVASGQPKLANTFLRGLEEPFVKRTVEGDLGMRFSAVGVLRSLSLETLKQFLNIGIDLRKELEFRSNNVNYLPENLEEENMDTIIAQLCTDTAFSRHVGNIESIYTPLGTMYYQSGKDLTGIEYVIGTGGVIIFDNRAKDILSRCVETRSKMMELRPKNPEFMLDNDYILSAMGLLGINHPEVALKIMKKRIVKI